MKTIEQVFSHPVVRECWARDVQRNEPSVLSRLSTICKQQELAYEQVLEYFLLMAVEPYEEQTQYEQARMLYRQPRDPLEAARAWMKLGYSRQALYAAQAIPLASKRAEALLFISGVRDKEREDESGDNI